MMTRKQICIGTAILALLIGLAVPPAQAELQSSFRRTASTGFGFLLVGQGARAAAMGEAFVPIADDITAIFWNPAGLVNVERGAYTFTYTRWFAQSRFYSGAAAYTTPVGVLGFSVISFTPDKYEETTIFKPQGTGQMVNGNGTAVGVAFARRLTNKLSVGLELRYLQQNLHRERVTQMDFGVSTMFYTGFASSRLAMSLKNFGSDRAVLTEEQFRMPMMFNFGAAMEVVGALGEPMSLTVSVSNTYELETEKEQFRLGSELWVHNTLALRAGYRFSKGLFGYSKDIFTYSVGAGVKRKFAGRSLGVDVSYSDVDEVFEKPVRVTLVGTF